MLLPNKSYYPICLLVTVFILFKCSTKPENILTNDYTFEKIIKVNYVESINLSDLIEPDFKLINLKTPDEHIVGEVTKVIHYKDHLIIQDNVSKTIWMFDEQGNYIRNFGSVGNGPGEYGYLRDFEVLDDELIVIDLSNRTILYFDLYSGKFLNEESAPIMESILPFKKNWAVYTPYGSGDTSSVFKIRSIDFENELACFFPYEENHDDIGMRGMISSNDDHLSYIKPLRGEIFYLNESYKLTPKYKLDFGEYSWSLTMEEIAQDQEKTEQTFMQEDIMSIAHQLIETDEYLIFQTFMFSEMYIEDAYDSKWLLILNKDTGKCSAIKNLENDFGDLTFPFPIGKWDYNGKLIGPAQATDPADENKNPTLMIYQLKSDLTFS